MISEKMNAYVTREKNPVNGDMLCGRCPHRKMRAAEIGMRTEKLIRIKSVPGIKILHVHDENSRL